MLVLLGCSTPAPYVATVCNGAAVFCDRGFDQVVYPTTHNAMSNADAGWAVPNQHHGLTRQLHDGVRGLMLDTHEWNGDQWLCHLFCELGHETLVDGLREIRDFLDDDANRGEVVTIIFETYITADETRAAFEKSGLMRYVHAQAAGAPWPTLRELIEANERVVVMTDADGGTYPWYLDEFAVAWQNPYAAETPAELSCAVDRGSSSNAIFIMNQFLTKTTGDPALADMVNHDPFLLDRARACRQQSGKLPNFLTVDFYDIGDLFAAVAALNGLS